MRAERYIILAVLALFVSCSQPQSQSNPALPARTDSVAAVSSQSASALAPVTSRYNFTDPKFILEDHKHKFYTGRIEQFDDEFFNKDRETEVENSPLYPVLDRESFDVFQSNEKVYDRMDEGTPYYYAIQHKGQHTGIIIKQMNNAWVNRFIYLAYDLSGKLVGTATLAGWGGDGGYGTAMTGEFINDSVFIKTTIETEHDFEKEMDKIIVNTTDEITIHFDGRIETRTIR